MGNAERKLKPPETCPVCGQDVPRKALACPGCGADHNSGWNDEATGLDGVVFTCSASKWHEHCEHASRAARSDIRGTVHRGRLGLWWGEIP